MNYSEARPQIKSGDILAWSHTGWKSWHDIKVQAVRMATRSEYSHVAVAWVVGNRVFALEAVMPCVRIFPLSKLGSFYWIPTEAKWDELVLENALSKVGEEYSQVSAIKAFFIKIEADGSWECAQYVMEVLSKCGIDLGWRATPDSVVLEAQKLDFPMHYIFDKEESK